MSIALIAVPYAQIDRAILTIRGLRVILDEDLATLYSVKTKALNQAVKRNIERFPEDFMFQLTCDEDEALRSHFVTANTRGGRRTLPYAFTEQGVAMLSSVLRSERAIQVNIEIVRTFVRLRHMIATNEILARKINTLEKKYDSQFKVVFDALRKMMSPPPPKRRPIGFTVSKDPEQ